MQPGTDTIQEPCVSLKAGFKYVERFPCRLWPALLALIKPLPACPPRRCATLRFGLQRICRVSGGSGYADTIVALIAIPGSSTPPAMRFELPRNLMFNGERNAVKCKQLLYLPRLQPQTLTFSYSKVAAIFKRRQSRSTRTAKTMSFGQVI